MAKRPGRKRKQGVDREPNGREVRKPFEGIAFLTKTWRRGVDFRDRVIDGRVVTLLERQTQIDAICALEPDAERQKRLKLAADTLTKLWVLSRKHATDAPNINDKVSRPGMAGLTVRLDTESDDAEFGRKVHRHYQEAMHTLAQQDWGAGYGEDFGRDVIRAVLAVCVENKTATQSGKDLCRKGLAVLAGLWAY